MSFRKKTDNLLDLGRGHDEFKRVEARPGEGFVQANAQSLD
jgi:hypothetical protein